MIMQQEPDWKIVIAERGWVYVGRVTREGDQVVIRNAFNVRRWGTAAGLGELARLGPRESTVLDDYGTIRVHVLAIPGGTVDCDDQAWSAWYARHVDQAQLAATKAGRARK
jgi:hypothetical protein